MPDRIKDVFSSEVFELKDFFPVKLISCNKMKLTPLKTRHKFSESFLSLHIWNIGLITVQFYTSTEIRPNKSYKWLFDQWKLKSITGTIRDISFKIAESFYLSKESNFVKKRNFILHHEPSTFLISYVGTKKDKAVKMDFLSKSEILPPNWKILELPNLSQTIYYDSRRAYFFFLRNNKIQFNKTIRVGVLFLFQVYFGFHAWLSHTALEKTLINTQNINIDLVKFFSRNLHPSHYSLPSNNPIPFEPYVSLFKGIIESDSSYKDNYVRIEKNIADKLGVKDDIVKSTWHRAIDLIQSGPILEKIENLLKLETVPDSSFIKQNRLLYLSFAVAVEAYEDQERESIISNLKVANRLKEIQALKDNNEDLPFPYSSIKTPILGIAYKTLLDNLPLVTLCSHGYLTQLPKGRGRPTKESGRKSVQYELASQWQNFQKIHNFF